MSKRSKKRKKEVSISPVVFIHTKSKAKLNEDSIYIDLSNAEWKGLLPSSLVPDETMLLSDISSTKPISLERLWRGSRVYQEDLDEKFNLKDSYYTRRDEIFSGKTEDPRIGKPVFTIFKSSKGEKRYSFIATRFKVLCPTYEKLVKETEEFKALTTAIAKG